MKSFQDTRSAVSPENGAQFDAAALQSSAFSGGLRNLVLERQAISFAQPLVHTSPHLRSLIHAQTLVQHGSEKFEPVLRQLRAGALSLRDLPEKRTGDFFSGALPTGAEVVLLTELSRTREQMEVARELQIEKTYRVRLARVLADLAAECQPPDTARFLKEVRSLNAAVSLSRWSEQLTAWLAAGDTAGPESANNVPLYFLDGNPHIPDRLLSALKRRVSAGPDGNCIVDLSAFKQDFFLGFEIASQGERIGRFILAVKDPESGRIKPLYKGPVAHLHRELPVELDSVGGASGEFSRFAAGVGPVDYDLAFGRRKIVNGNPAYIDLISDVANERRPHLTIPAYAVDQGYTHVAPVVPHAALRHFVRKRTLVGSTIWMKGSREDSHQKHPGELVCTVAIDELSSRKIRFRSIPMGAASRTQHHGIRVLAGKELKNYLRTGEGEPPQYSPIRVIRSATTDRAPRVQFAGQDFSLPRRFAGQTVVPKILDLPDGTRLLGFFEPNAGKHDVSNTRMLFTLDAETGRLVRWENRAAQATAGSSRNSESR